MGIPMLAWSLLIGASSNLDNMGIGLSYSIRNMRIPALFYTIVPVLSFLACLLGALTGNRISHFMSAHTCSVIGSLILIIIGLWIVAQAFVSNLNTSDNATNAVGFHEVMIVALAQSMSDLSIGFGSSFTGLNALFTAASVGLFSFVFMFFPCLIRPKNVPVKLGRSTAAVSGLLLIAVGLIQ